MNTKLLKQKILDLAIRGKLTQQLKSDGTAKDLLKQISEQKRESSSTLSSPRRRGSPSAQSEKTIIPLDKSEAPFEIPANWEWVRLGDVASDFQYGSAEKSQPEGKIAVLRMGNINRQGQVDYSDLVYTSNDAEIAKYLLNKNDVLFNRTNSPEWVGKTAIYKGEIPAIYAGYIIRIKPHFNSDYLNYLMCSDYERNWSKEVKTDGVHQSNINAQKLMAFAVPLPPLAEQQRIVEKIQEAFAEIDSVENNKELLKTHIKQTRQKILDLAIHGKLVPQNKTDEPASVLLERITRDNPHYEKLTDIPFEIPDSWEWTSLGVVCEEMQSAKPKGDSFKYIDIDSIDNTICKIKAPKVIESKNAPSRASRYTKKGDILFSLVRPYLRNIAKVEEDNCIASTGFYVCSPKNINENYCYYLMISHYVVDGLNQYMKGDNSPSISSKNIIEYPIPLPPLAEQKRIVDRIEEIFASLDEISLHLV